MLSVEPFGCGFELDVLGVVALYVVVELSLTTVSRLIETIEATPVT